MNMYFIRGWYSRFLENIIEYMYKHIASLKTGKF